MHRQDMTIAERLSALLERVDEQRGADVPLSAFERMEMIRTAAQIARDADAAATASYAATKTLQGEDWDRALEDADMAEGHHRSATLILLALICGNGNAVAQMDAIERRCKAGGF